MYAERKNVLQLCKRHVTRFSHVDMLAVVLQMNLSAFPAWTKSVSPKCQKRKGQIAIKKISVPFATALL